MKNTIEVFNIKTGVIETMLVTKLVKLTQNKKSTNYRVLPNKYKLK